MELGEAYINELEVLQTRLLERVDALLKKSSNLSTDQQIKLIMGLSFFDEMQNLGLNTALSKLQGDLDKQIGFVLRKRGEIRPKGEIYRDLRLFRDVEMAGHLENIKNYSSTLKREVIRGLLSNESISTISARLEGTFSAGNILTSGRARTLVNDTMSIMGRYSIMKLYEDEPNKKFEYVGPLDDKTRDVCRDVLKKGGSWTMEEIQAGKAGSGVSFTDGGGWNCRHEWLPE